MSQWYVAPYMATAEQEVNIQKFTDEIKSTRLTHFLIWFRWETDKGMNIVDSIYFNI